MNEYNLKANEEIDGLNRENTLLNTKINNYCLDIEKLNKTIETLNTNI